MSRFLIGIFLMLILSSCTTNNESQIGVTYPEEKLTYSLTENSYQSGYDNEVNSYRVIYRVFNEEDIRECFHIPDEHPIYISNDRILYMSPGIESIYKTLVQLAELSQFEDTQKDIIADFATREETLETFIATLEQLKIDIDPDSVLCSVVNEQVLHSIWGVTDTGDTKDAYYFKCKIRYDGIPVSDLDHGSPENYRMINGSYIEGIYTAQGLEFLSTQGIYEIDGISDTRNLVSTHEASSVVTEKYNRLYISDGNRIVTDMRLEYMMFVSEKPLEFIVLKPVYVFDISKYIEGLGEVRVKSVFIDAHSGLEVL